MNNIAFGVSFAAVFVSVFLSYLFVMYSKETETMAKNGLLFISSAARAHNACLMSSKHVNRLLYIKFKDTNHNLPVISKQIVQIYSKASSEYSNLDIRLILKPLEASTTIKTNHPLDLILYDSELSREVDTLKSMVSLKSNELPKSIDLSNELDSELSNESVKRYSHVAVGGTFDRLHNGHKILLSQAALRATKHLTVGVTDVNMIQSKKLWELIEPVERRIKAILDFLTDINPGLEYNVVPIQDMYGPTKHDARLEMIVVSEETARGGAKVNEKRKENGLSPLDVFVITMAQDSSQRAEDEEEKVSSSNVRMRMLGTVLKAPVPNPDIPTWPYVIGLAGGIASGKSNIAEKLKAKGAAIVNCDLIAHELYKPGLPLNSTLAETFGKHIITETGEVDRKKLGSIVFGDQMQLEKLNSIIWPAIIAEAENRIRALGQSGHRVVVIEAAVMVRAKWYTRCHQLWAVIIPPDEAIKRLQKRNSLTEEEAKQRIVSQPPNSEQIEYANVVFSPFWSYEYTQTQIDKAWDSLQAYLRDRK